MFVLLLPLPDARRRAPTYVVESIGVGFVLYTLVLVTVPDRRRKTDVAGPVLGLMVILLYVWRSVW